MAIKHRALNEILKSMMQAKAISGDSEAIQKEMTFTTIKMSKYSERKGIERRT